MKIRCSGRSVFAHEFECQDVQEGIAINPKLPKHFGCMANESRPDEHLAWWGVPFIETYASDDEKFIAHWGGSVRYDVRCLDGGAWDRPTCLGMFGSLDEAVTFAKRFSKITILPEQAPAQADGATCIAPADCNGDQSAPSAEFPPSFGCGAAIALLALVLAFVFTGRVRADSMELRPVATPTGQVWQVTVRMPLYLGWPTNFTTLYGAERIGGTNRWHVLTPAWRENTTRFYIVTNGAAGFFHLKNGEVAPL